MRRRPSSSPQPGATLVETTLGQLTGRGVPAGRIALVGPQDLPCPPETLLVRENPPFSGPAAALAAGARTLDHAGIRSGWTLTLACDMPRVGAAVDALLRAVQAQAEASERVRGIVLVDRGILQPLAAVCRTEVLIDHLAAAPVVDRSVRSVMRPLWERQLAVGGLTEDVDTWDDVSRFGFVPGHVED